LQLSTDGGTPTPDNVASPEVPAHPVPAPEHCSISKLDDSFLDTTGGIFVEIQRKGQKFAGLLFPASKQFPSLASLTSADTLGGTKNGVLSRLKFVLFSKLSPHSVKNEALLSSDFFFVFLFCPCAPLLARNLLGAVIAVIQSRNKLSKSTQTVD
jgi:hypothetical protein